MLIGLFFLALFCGTIDASGLNIIGMPLSAHPMGDSMDFTMGGKGNACDDEEEEEDEGGDDQGQNQCLDVKASAWTLSNVSSLPSIARGILLIKPPLIILIFSSFKICHCAGTITLN